MRATRAVIHLNHLRNNIRSIKHHLKPGVKVCLAVKADAYGHGAIEVSEIAASEGVEYLGIATLEEGLEIRRAGLRVPLLLLSLPIPEEIPELVTAEIFPIVANAGLIELIQEETARQQKRLEVHLKVDTGMGRIGCQPEQALTLARLIHNSPILKLGGICTHFPGADLQDKSFTLKQLDLFARILRGLKVSGIEPGLVHAANSGAIIDLPEAQHSMARPGILAYGYYPSDQQAQRIPVTPVMEFKTKIVFLKQVPAGTTISYGMTYTTDKQTIIATLPVGYADGYNRLLSNKSEVLIRGRRYPLAGRVCMDQCMIDLGQEAEVRLYDDVVLFGPDTLGPNAAELANHTGTIPYEVTCLVSKRVPRIYTA